MRWTVLAALVLPAACSKTAADGAPAPSAAQSASAGASSTTAAAKSPSPAASASGPSTWQGTYKSAAGTLYIPPDWKSVRWAVADTPAGVGDGAMTLTVDPANGRVQGTLDGSLGPATIDGTAAEGKLAATIRRRDPGDRGFTGTLEGTLSNAHGEGTMNLSLAEASALRTATFTLAPASAPATGSPR